MRHLTQLRYIDVVAREKSIRQAADKLAITSTALNRRILALEEELGTPLFERLPSGVRLNTAGELLVQHIRSQISDLNRVLSQIADLSGVRRGHIQISACPEALAGFLPAEIARYRQDYANVTFEMMRHDPAEGLAALTDLSADLALIFDSVLPQNFQIAASARQQLFVLLARDHPLAGKTEIKLQECLDYPVILPGGASSIRTLLSVAALRKSITLEGIIETNSFDFITSYLAHEKAISFQIAVGLPGMDGRDSALLSVPLAAGESAPGLLHLVQLKGRVLPVAAAKFMDQLVQSFNRHFPEETA